MPSDDDSPSNRTGDTLARIAKTLGCPVETFSDEADESSNIRGASELLTIWVELDSDADRERLLTYARRLAQV